LRPFRSQVLVPLVKALLGEERANALVRKPLGNTFRRLREQWWQSKQSTHVGENMASAFASFDRVADGHVGCAVRRPLGIGEGAPRSR